MRAKPSTHDAALDWLEDAFYIGEDALETALEAQASTLNTSLIIYGEILHAVDPERREIISTFTCDFNIAEIE